jgi:alkylation response protein AidB-like acyl-CoA dehydrogenase
VLWPDAAAVDRLDRVPAAHLDALAAAGFYGLAGPDAPADPELPGFALETFAGACLATAFVWMQHHGAVRAVAGCDRPGVRDRWLDPLTQGQVRAGVGFAGLRPGRDRLRVRRDGDRWLLDGQIPWVTGWGVIDVLYLGACDENDVIHRFLMDAAAAPTVTAQIQQLSAVQASSTATLTFTGHPVPDDRLLETQPLAEWTAAEAAGSPANGFLAVGLARRCLRLLADAGADTEPLQRLGRDLDDVRTQLQAASTGGVGACGEPVDLPRVRAAASALAARAAGWLTVQTGSRAVLAGGPADRLGREAAFLLVFGSRAAIKRQLLDLVQEPMHGVDGC